MFKNLLLLLTVVLFACTAQNTNQNPSDNPEPDRPAMGMNPNEAILEVETLNTTSAAIQEVIFLKTVDIGSSFKYVLTPNSRVKLHDEKALLKSIEPGRVIKVRVSPYGRDDMGGTFSLLEIL